MQNQEPSLTERIASLPAGEIKVASLQDGATDEARPEEGHLVVFRCRYAALTKGADPFRMAAAAPAGGDLHIAVLGHDETPLPLAVAAGLLRMHPGGRSMVAAQPQYAYSTQRPFHAPPAGAVARMFHLELLASYPHAGCLLGLEKDDSSQPRDSPGEPVSGEDGTEWRELQVRRVPCKVTESADLALETILPGYWVVLSLQARSLAASGRVNSDEGTLLAEGGGSAGSSPGAFADAQVLASIAPDWAQRVAAGAEEYSAALSAPATVGVVIGSGHLPDSIEEAVRSMSQGEKATVLCDAADVRALAAAGLANAAGDHLSGAEGWATVEVRVCGVLQRRDLGGGGSKTRLVRGEGEFPADCPLHDCEVRVRAVGRDPESGAVFWQTEGAQASAMELGEAVMPDALERGIRLMTPGEIALVEVPAGDMKDDVAGGNPGGGRGQYLVELVSFDRLEDGAEGDADGMLKRANDMKQSGSRLYQKGRVDLAETKYKRALDMARRAMMEMDAGDVDRRDAAMELGLACTLNLASCAIATKSFAQAVEWCGHALSEDEQCAKGYLRRSKAHIGLADYDSAAKDIERARAALESLLGAGRAGSVSAVSESDIASAEASLKRIVAESKRKERQQFGGMFGH